ncbi:peptidyl-prolyl cis-trans isomerase-like 4, partial [Mytilus galloprovincialis]
MSVIIETSLGDFTIDLFTDERPKCCKNFLKLCKVKYYNFCLFHSVQRNFIAQTGDPDGNGRGGESIYGTLYGEQARYFDWEFVPKIKHVKQGLVSMVNNGNNMHGSQFFLTLGDSLDYLDGVHTVIGEITEGLEVIQKLNESYCDEKFKPFRDIRIHHTIILEDPFEDPPGLDMPDRSPSPPPAVIERARLAADAEIDDLEGMTEEEIREIMEEREEKANAQLLEMTSAAKFYFSYNTTFLNHFATTLRLLQHTCLTNISTMKNNEIESLISQNNIYIMFFLRSAYKTIYFGNIDSIVILKLKKVKRQNKDKIWRALRNKPDTFLLKKFFNAVSRAFYFRNLRM